MKPTVNIREMNPDEKAYLKKFLYDAIFIPKGQKKPNPDILNQPELARYIQNFGQAEDLCLVAEFEKQVIGAVWTRIFPKNAKGFGFVDEYTPELSMSVTVEYRNKGIGTQLLTAMLQKLKIRYEQVSLSVDKQNFACKLYKKFGFNIVKEDEKSMIMVKKLTMINEE